jgi:hypothetical protein
MYLLPSQLLRAITISSPLQRTLLSDVESWTARTAPVDWTHRVLGRTAVPWDPGQLQN